MCVVCVRWMYDALRFVWRDVVSSFMLSCCRVVCVCVCVYNFIFYSSCVSEVFILCECPLLSVVCDTYMCVCLHVRMCGSVCVCVCMCLYVYVCAYIFVYIYIYIYICIYIYIFIYLWVCMYVCMCVFVCEYVVMFLYIRATRSYIRFTEVLQFTYVFLFVIFGL